MKHVQAVEEFLKNKMVSLFSLKDSENNIEMNQMNNPH